MAIRLRKVKNKTAIGGFSYVALCAAESEKHPDDVYLDDGMHNALSKKFREDFTKMGFMTNANYKAYPWLFERYINMQLSTPMIAKEARVHPKTIYYWLKKNHIRIRTKSEANKLYGDSKRCCGDKSSRWNGGRVLLGGSRGREYWGIYQGAINGKTVYKLEHVLKAEKALGRELNGKKEVVHHINLDQLDNRNTNLLVCSRGYHRTIHESMTRAYAREHLGG